MRRTVLFSSVVVVFVVLSAGIASAGVMTFDVDQTWNQGTGQTDLPAQSVSLGGAGSFTLDPGGSGTYFDFTFGGGGTFSTINTSIEDYFFLLSYSAGDIVGLGNFGDHTSAVADWDTILVDGSTAGVWGSSHDGYLGFRSDSGSYGWIDYSFTRAGGVSTLTLNDGAYEDVAGVGILVGMAAIPEPGSLALFGVGLGAAGIVASLLRRRRRQEPAGSV